MRKLLITSKELDYDYKYTFFLTIDQAPELLNAEIGNIIYLEEEESWIVINAQTITIRHVSGGGIASLDKTDVVRQIEYIIKNPKEK